MAGWAPAYGEERRRDFSRAASRARALRKQETPHEKRLWKLLREVNREGANFRRQTNIGDRVFDFAELGSKMLIELDGAIHERLDVREADKAKEIDAILRGYKVVRVTNTELSADPGAVIERIKQVLATRPSPHRGEGRVGGRTTGFAASETGDAASHATAASHLERPVPLTPAPRGGGGDQP